MEPTPTNNLFPSLFNPSTGISPTGRHPMTQVAENALQNMSAQRISTSSSSNSQQFAIKPIPPHQPPRLPPLSSMKQSSSSSSSKPQSSISSSLIAPQTPLLNLFDDDLPSLSSFTKNSHQEFLNFLGDDLPPPPFSTPFSSFQTFPSNISSSSLNPLAGYLSSSSYPFSSNATSDSSFNIPIETPSSNKRKRVEEEKESNNKKGRDLRPPSGDKSITFPLSQNMQKKRSISLQTDPKNAENYEELAKNLEIDGTIQFADGSSMTKQMLFLKIIELNPSCAFAYNNLANTLVPGSSTWINGTMMTQEELYEKSIELNPNEPLGYYNLSRIIPNDKMKVKRELILKAIKLRPGFAIAYSSLGNTLTGEESFQFPDSNLIIQLQLLLPRDCNIQFLNNRVTKPQLFLICIHLDPKFALTYYNLGTLLPKGGSIQLLNGKKMTQQNLFWQAIELNSEFSLAYLGLSTTLREGDSIRLPKNDTIMTKQQLYDKAIELDPLLSSKAVLF